MPDRRVWLVTPGTSPGRFETARGSGANVALLDLEDSVPGVAKDVARADVLSFLARAHRLGGDGAACPGCA
ncbi:aldolase/citrate lyase family protein [Embleya scabrispora]|uniref:aldolase/citrate lyase family protein n=1 Tax=Embleya scabrispora TaxID=159449 RepID=UPI001374E356|nr:aldolase/citrate lyase family protein [Embleya scabrispora]